MVKKRFLPELRVTAVFTTDAVLYLLLFFLLVFLVAFSNTYVAFPVFRAVSLSSESPTGRNALSRCHGWVRGTCWQPGPLHGAEPRPAPMCPGAQLIVNSNANILPPRPSHSLMARTRSHLSARRCYSATGRTTGNQQLPTGSSFPCNNVSCRPGRA